MDAIIATFTSNDEIDHYIVGDATTELKGFVDAIESPKPVGKAAKILFKIVINNAQGRRVRVLFWEELALKYSPLISARKVITIKRCRPSLANLTYANPAEGIAPIELSAMAYSEITLGVVCENSLSNAPAREIDLQEVANADGLMYVTGFVKLPFEAITAGGSTFGTGCIVKGPYKLRVQIADFTANDNITIGREVRVLGEKKEDRNGYVYLQLKNSDEIQVLQDSAPADVLRQGVRTPSKRLCEPQNQGEGSVDSEKKRRLQSE